jgi:hypothetical protein
MSLGRKVAGQLGFAKCIGGIFCCFPHLCAKISLFRTNQYESQPKRFAVTQRIVRSGVLPKNSRQDSFKQRDVILVVLDVQNSLDRVVHILTVSQSPP